jgi:hypothetical protein
MNNNKERYLLDTLAMLQESYAKAAKPYIEQLVFLSSIQPLPPMIITFEQAREMGFTVDAIMSGLDYRQELSADSSTNS